jgi:hypothetical protein
VRWNKEPDPKVGNERRIVKFLFKPLCICGQTRWLERAVILQEFEEWYQYNQWTFPSKIGVPNTRGWVNKAWVDVL